MMPSVKASCHAGRDSTLRTARVPRAAMVLGAAGLLPFLALSFMNLLVDGTLGDQATRALTAYGAVILSFLGGIHWGLAIENIPAGSEGDDRLFRRLTCSIVPALIGWIALLMPPTVSLSVLAAAFISVLAFDLIACRNGDAPDWYPRLRVPLTIIVVLSLSTGVFN
jgi:hypothetical protein